MTRQTQRERDRKARERTERWRERRKEERAPEARQIDRAVAAAIVHVVQADKEHGRLPKELLPAIAHVATFILEKGHDRLYALGAVEDRLEALGRSQEVRRARERAIRRMPE